MQLIATFSGRACHQGRTGTIVGHFLANNRPLPQWRSRLDNVIVLPFPPWPGVRRERRQNTNANPKATSRAALT